MFRGSPVEVAAQADISENFTLHSAVDRDGDVELVFSGGTQLMLSFSRRGFAQLKAQWPEVVAKVDAELKTGHTG